MAVSQEALLKALKNVRKPLETAVTNARVRKVLRRLNNEDEGFDFGADEGEVEEIVEEDGGEEVGVGDVVEVEIPEGTTVTAKVVDTEPEEIVEETEIVEGGDEGEGEGEEETVENVRHYRRVKNARVIRNKDGSLDVLVPVASKNCGGAGCGAKKTGKKVTNVRRRYKVRTVTRNSGYEPESAYAKKIPGDGIDAISKATYIEMARKAKLYDRLVANATIDQAIEESIDKALKKQGIANTRKARKSVRNLRRRSFRNEDGEYTYDFVDEAVEAPVDTAAADAPFVDEAQGAIVIPLSDAEMTTLADELDDAAEDTAEVEAEIEAPAEVEEDVISENARRILNKRLGRVARRVKNIRRAPKAKVVKNEAAVEEKAEEKAEVADTTVTVENSAVDICGLSLPSTFPTK